MTTLDDVREHICTNHLDLALEAIDKLGENEIIFGKIVKSKILGDRGNFSEAMRLLNEIFEYKNQNFEVRFGTIVSMINLYWKQAKFQCIPELITEGDINLQFIQDEKSDFVLWFKGHYFNTIGNYYWDMGELSLALENYNKSLEIRKKLGIAIEIAKSINNLGNIHYMKGEYDLALQIYEESLNLKRKIDPSTDLSASLANIGTIYRDMGHLSKALRYFNESNDFILRSKSDDHSAMSFRFLEIGYIHTLKGELAIALMNFEKAKSIYENLDNQFQLGRTLGYIGNVWYYKKDHRKAEHFLLESLNRLAEFENEFEISTSLYWMILVKLAKKSLSEASEYLDKFRIISERSVCVGVKIRYKLAKAIVNQNQPRLISQVQASDLFSEIIRDPLVNEIIKNKARVGVCDLLIREFEVLKNEDLAIEINDLIGLIYKYGQQEQAFPFIIKALEFRSRICYHQQKYQLASKLLDIADFYASERGLELLKSSLWKTKKRLSLSVYGWGKVYDMMSDFKKSIDKHSEDQAILEYLEDLKKFKFHS